MNTSSIRNPYSIVTYDPSKPAKSPEERVARQKANNVALRVRDSRTTLETFDNGNFDDDRRNGFVSVSEHSSTPKGGSYSGVMTPDYLTTRTEVVTSNPLRGATSEIETVHSETVDGKVVRNYLRTSDSAKHFGGYETDVAFNADGTVTVMEGVTDLS